MTTELRELIPRMAAENPTWRAPRIHGEMLKLGWEVSERTVSRYLARLGRKREAGKRGLIFLNNHRQAIAAMDFFTVPTATFRVLSCFFLISHGRRRVLHFNATEHPTSQWIVQQLPEAFPVDSAPKDLILDRDGKFDGDVTAMIECLASQLIRTAYRSPWQNGVAERWVGSCRTEWLDPGIVFNEAPLRRRVRESLRSSHQDRTHVGLGKETPVKRPRERRKTAESRVEALPRVGGLPPRYTWHTVSRILIWKARFNSRRNQFWRRRGSYQMRVPVWTPCRGVSEPLL